MRKPWKRPKWITPFLALIDGDVDEAMGCNREDCNVVINAPRAMIHVAIQSQVGLLMQLRKFGIIRVCRDCGCTDLSACEDGCSWVKENLCSGCQ